MDPVLTRRACIGGLGMAAVATRLAAEEPGKAPPMIAGPDLATRRPAFAVPPGTIDTHTHIFGPQALFPYSPKRPYTPPEAPLAMFSTLHGRLGIDRAVIVNATVHGTDAAPVLDAIARSGGRYRGIVNIDDSFDEAALADLNERGIRGCRFTFISYLGGPADMGVFDRALPKIAPLGWHVDLYLEPKMIPQMAPRLQRLPVNYVIDHMGLPKAADGLEQPNFRALLKLLRDDEKCWVKVMGLERASASGPPFADAVPFARALIETAPDRVIWGSDWPHPNVRFMPNDGDLVDLIPQYAPDPTARQKLLVDNPTRLFGFK
jgi:predicted TIM-barrel fold metal-dependent hydrolase